MCADFTGYIRTALDGTGAGVSTKFLSTHGLRLYQAYFYNIQVGDSVRTGEFSTTESGTS